MYIDGAVDAILKGTGHQVYSMNVNIADALTSCIFALTLIPSFGINGYIVSIYATEILNTTLSLYKMFSVSKMKPKIFHQVFMPILCIIGATNGSNLTLSLMKHPFSCGIELTLHIILTLCIYIALLIITKTVGSEENEFLYAALLSEKKYKSRFT
jgi:O-antigen/teichoic acid export membrane protein